MDILRPVMDADLLVLDDLGAEKTSEWVEETMNLIVNTRYNERRHHDLHVELRRHAGRSTTLDSLKARIGFRMHSRLHEMCEFLEYDGADYRHLPPNGGVDDLLMLWKRKPARAQAPAGARQGSGPRPAASEPRAARPSSAGRAAKQELRSDAIQSVEPNRDQRHRRNSPTCSASTSTSRSAPPSATTATSTAACSTPG